jgi:hypothetical protein
LVDALDGLPNLEMDAIDGVDAMTRHPIFIVFGHTEACHSIADGSTTWRRQCLVLLLDVTAIPDAQLGGSLSMAHTADGLESGFH